MSKPPKFDLKALIAGEVGPASQAPAEVEAESQAQPDPASSPAQPREVVTLKPRRTAPAQKPAGEGTLKQRAHQLSVYLEEPVYDALREIAHVERSKLHPLILEGIDMVLKKRGSPSIKELTKRAG
jgi:hypothetical protein